MGHTALLAWLVHNQGADLCTTLVALSATQNSESLGWALAAYDDAPAAEALVRMAGRSARSAKALHWFCEQRPATALRALSQVLAEGSLPKGTATRLTPLLKTTSALVGEGLPALMQNLAPAAQRLLAPMTEALDSTREMAPRSQWPAVLAAPPWAGRTSKPTTDTALDLAVMEVPAAENWGTCRREDYVLGAHPRSKTPLEACAELAQYLPGWTAERILRLQTVPAHIDGFIADWQAAHGHAKYNGRGGPISAATHFARYLPPTVALAFWNQVSSLFSIPPRFNEMMARFGVAAAPGLLNVIHNEAISSPPITWDNQPAFFFAQFMGTTAVAPIMAQAMARRPTRRAMARGWLRRFPDHAAAGLLPAALGQADAARQEARAALRALAAMDGAQAIRRAAQRYDNRTVQAAAEALLAEDPLHDYPARITARSKLPVFWQPAGWRHPRLRESGLALPDEALHPLGLMLSFTADMPQRYAGIDAVLAACEPQSVADFAWDACQAWEAAGCSAPSHWALRALGAVGTDDTARQLGALARRWGAPGSGASTKRIGWVLEALALLGTDTALLQLDALARKGRALAVREQAAQRLSEAAEVRGLTPEQLQDRVVPDLGLDARGHLMLDFGPRQFVVGFDEALVPHVREWAGDRPGPRLSSAPRPRASDDAALAAQAVARYKALKQDAATTASQQPARLERAMCDGRRWTPAEFRQFLAEHPLMRHLAQRLVWGVQPPASANAAPANGALFDPPRALHSTFRVTAEGEWVDADDEAWAAPAGWDETADSAWTVVLPHPLQLDAEQIAAFSQQLADYELIQPFEQLQRSVYRLPEAEAAQHALTRWVGQHAWPGPLWGLQARGWERGHGDDGIYNHAVRRLPEGGTLTLLFQPGLDRSDPNDRGAPQTLGELQYGAPLSGLSPIAFSEAVRDMVSIAR
ncbi:DUF4132 domain-containing protein [Ottowia sp.]|uniref:DUF4132 domain-containing protein n=1 Tax=Ottowia sp. TaxID=1898956 RepID=UPI003A88B7C0